MGFRVGGLGFGAWGLGFYLPSVARNERIFRAIYSPAQVDRIWLWVCYRKIPIYPIFYQLKGGYMQSPEQYNSSFRFVIPSFLAI